MILSYVGVAGFEPTTSCSQSRRDTGLRYTPKRCNTSIHSVTTLGNQFAPGAITGRSLSVYRRAKPRKGVFLIFSTKITLIFYKCLYFHRDYFRDPFFGRPASTFKHSLRSLNFLIARPESKLSILRSRLSSSYCRMMIPFRVTNNLLFSESLRSPNSSTPRYGSKLPVFCFS
jgi:hypothetical protein